MHMRLVQARVCVPVVGEVVRVELISSLALFSHSCFLIKRN